MQRLAIGLGLAACALLPHSAKAQFWSVNGAMDIYNSNSGKDVGIGTSSPLYRLHVVSDQNVKAQNGAFPRAIFGLTTSTTLLTYGVVGRSNSPINGSSGVHGASFASNGLTMGVYGLSTSSNGVGVLGFAGAASGTTYGLFGSAASPDGWAGYFAGQGYFDRLAIGASTTANYPLRVLNTTPDYAAILGEGQEYGVEGMANEIGVAGHAQGPFGRGVTGSTDIADTDGTGVWGRALALTGDTVGVEGITQSTTGVGVRGAASQTGANYGVLGQADGSDGWAVYGNGRLGADMKLFRIDHPLDPANKELLHYCIEGPEPLLVYRGNTILDSRGEAWVELPAYFDAINRDCHFQLTPIGAFAPLYVAEEVNANSFKIGGGFPGMKVSWMVTGVRNDAYVRSHGAPVEVLKQPHQVGKFLQPTLYGQSESNGAFYRRDHDAMPE